MLVKVSVATLSSRAACTALSAECGVELKVSVARSPQSFAIGFHALFSPLTGRDLNTIVTLRYRMPEYRVHSPRTSEDRGQVKSEMAIKTQPAQGRSADGACNDTVDCRAVVRPVLRARLHMGSV